MTSDKLSRAYLEKARIRIKALKFLHKEGGFSDVVRRFTALFWRETGENKSLQPVLVFPLLGVSRPRLKK